MAVGGSPGGHSKTELFSHMIGSWSSENDYPFGAEYFILKAGYTMRIFLHFFFGALLFSTKDS